MRSRHPDDGASSAERIHLRAQASGHGHIYQTVNGAQNVVHQHHHYGDGLPAPLALPELRLWIARLAADYRTLVKSGDGPPGRREAVGHKRQLERLAGELSGSAGRGDGKNQLRRLLTAGAVQYLGLASGVPGDPLPEQLMVDLAVFALWPVVVAPALPDDWQDHLAELTGPRLAVLVGQARELGARGQAPAVEAFGRVLAEKPFAHGVLALLEDLADPRGGGACLTAMSLAERLPPPPQKDGAKAVLTWLLAAGAGAAATEGPDLAERVWHWLQGTARGTSPRPGGDPGHVDSGDDPEQHRGGGSGRHTPVAGRGPDVGPPGAGPGGRGGVTGFLDDLFS
ncbi:hypothetical protein ACH4TV_44725 [Streptomyces sp. NPDC020898]|uniref:hypothetical protein n=1 Tax=Streptomyces sp. NPDC020898 TaxID=3365101 RepID=UPI0037894EFA